MTDNVDIDALVERAIRRDRDAFRALYEEFAPRLYRFCLFRVRHAADAEDLVQRVFVKMIEALPRYEQRGLPFGAWVFRMARNAVIDFERTRHPSDSLDAAEMRPGEAPGPDEVVELSLEREALVSALRVLTAEQQEVVTLRFFGGLSPREIGELMDKREGSIRALQFRAIEALRRHLAETGGLAQIDALEATARVEPDLDDGPSDVASTAPHGAHPSRADNRQTADETLVAVPPERARRLESRR
jgi:RNA polymerase sigma-70 factor (ECF subfamily)